MHTLNNIKFINSHQQKQEQWNWDCILSLRKGVATPGLFHWQHQDCYCYWFISLTTPRLLLPPPIIPILGSQRPPTAINREVMHALHNTEAHLCNHCHHGKAVSITHHECVFVALVIPHAKCISHTVICGLCGYTIFFHVISWMAQFSEKSNLHKTCFGFLYNFCPKHFSF